MRSSILPGGTFLRRPTPLLGDVLHRHTDDIYLGRVGIGGVLILHEKGLIKIIWSNSCLVGTFIEIE